MKSGVSFIICTTSSAVYERTDSMAGGSGGAMEPWSEGLAGMG